MKKTLFFFVLILSLCLVLCACDGGSTDGGSTDGGSTDGGSTDGGSTDGGSTDGGSTDGGSTDGGSTDGGSKLLSFTGISFADKTVVYNGTEQTVSGYTIGDAASADDHVAALLCKAKSKLTAKTGGCTGNKSNFSFYVKIIDKQL